MNIKVTGGYDKSNCTTTETSEPINFNKEYIAMSSTKSITFKKVIAALVLLNAVGLFLVAMFIGLGAPLLFAFISIYSFLAGFTVLLGVFIWAISVLSEGEE